MQVAALLRSKGSDVATVTPATTVGEVVETLRSANVGAVVVSQNGTSIDGIVSERDIVRALGVSEGLMELPVSEIMTARVFTCTPSDQVDHLMHLMTVKRARHLPVEVDGALVGIISIGDVVKSRLAELEEEAKTLTEYLQQGR